MIMILLVLVSAMVAIVSLIVLFIGVLGELTGNGNRRMIKNSFVAFIISMIFLMTLSRM